MMKKFAVLSWFSIAPAAAFAAGPDGAALPAAWGLPFAGLLLSIALFPLGAPAFWHRHFGKIAAFWGAAFALPFAATHGAAAAGVGIVHALLAEYVPFIVLLGALYTVAGGICVHGNLNASPRLNAGLLLLGTLLASVMGTTGAAMLLIRPLLRANDHRKHVVHVVVFFIFLVANAGGALTPLGDPPLFLGFLQGVDFFWTARHLYLPTSFVCAALLVLFYLIDAYYFRKHGEQHRLVPDPEAPRDGVRIDGKINFVLLGCVTALVLISGVWKPGVGWDVYGTRVELQGVVRDVGLLAVASLSLAVTPRTARAGNDFNWAPIAEVAKLFAGIFVTMVPVIAMLRAGEAGAFAGVVRLVTGGGGQPVVPMYFWATGLLSSMLDNAPTYLVFFNLAGGHAPTLMGTDAATLAAISAGAVFMGALTYIGNAPNFMVKAIAEARGVPMPSFFGYLLWSGMVLVPLFLAANWLFFGGN